MAAKPVEPALALHQSVCTKASPTFSGTFSRTFSGTLLNLPWLFCTKASWNLLRNLLRNLLPTLLNLTWLCTKASQTFSRTFSGTLLDVSWLCTKTSQAFSGTFGTFSGTSLNLTRCLHQRAPELFWAEDPISSRCWGKNNPLVNLQKIRENHPLFMGKSTISMAMFNSELFNYQRVIEYGVISKSLDC